MTASRAKRPSASTRRTLAVLLIVSLAVLLTPQLWWHKLISVVQVIAPFQHAVRSSTETIGEALTGNAPPVSAAEHDALWRARQAAEHQIAALSARIDELEREVGLLTATRLWNAADAPIGAGGRLIPARVLTEDLIPWRSSRLLTAGAVQGVERGAPVVSDYFTINRGEESGVANGRAILLGESLIGFVVQTGTHTSRVQLLSDPTTQMKVRLGRHDTGQFSLIDGYFWLTGRGRGVMEVRDVKRQDVDAERIRVGDLVLSDPTSPVLPAALVLGTVTEVTTDPRAPLFATLRITAAVDPASLERVYVFDRGE